MDQRFDLPRHGNATKPTSRQYYRKDPTLFLKVDNLIGKGLSTDQVYDSIARAGASTVSEAIPGPKLIDNRKLLSKKETSPWLVPVATNNSKVKQRRWFPAYNRFLSSKVQLSPKKVMFFQQSLQHDQWLLPLLHKWEFGTPSRHYMWTCSRALAHWHNVHKRTLIDLKGKNPEFPGPSFWHFRKTRECYQRFAGEIVIKKPERLKIKKIGHDLDKALSQGLCDVFNEAKRVWCTQHTQERDVHKLKTIGCTQRSQSRVMSDIYGTQDAVLLQNGLADKDE